MSSADDLVNTSTSTDNNKQEETPSSSSSKRPRLSEEDDDADEEEEEEESVSIDLDSLDRESLMALLTQISASQNIPLSVLLQSLNQQPFDDDDDDDEDIEYPFGTVPTNLQHVAEFIQSDQCQRILVLAGAGMSVAAGIPDYRSHDGFYATLQAHQLTATPQQQAAIQQDKTFALDQHLFLENPLPCLELKRDFILGVHERRWKPTLAHRFCALLAQQHSHKLVRWYTQNIDGLEDLSTLGDKVVHVHGTMSQADCAHCGAMQDTAAFHQHVKTHIKDVTGHDPMAPTTSQPMLCTNCHQPGVKPAIVLFRSSLPKVFFEKLPQDLQDIDLLLILGTSLRVAPANSIVWRVPSSCLRVVINREPVGQHLGIRHSNPKRDFHAAGDCESVVLELMEHMGWLSLLEECVDDLPTSSAQLLRDKLEEKKKEAQECDKEVGKERDKDVNKVEDILS
jgi:NAD-dependent SIR2 family protein deacetylase